MSIAATHWALQQNPGSQGRKLVLLVLADHADEVGVCWPSIRRVADICNMTVRGVRKCIADLESQALVERHPHFREDGSQTSTRYVLPIPDRKRWGVDEGGGEHSSGGEEHSSGPPEPGFRGPRNGGSALEPSDEPSKEDRSPNGDSSSRGDDPSGWMHQEWLERFGTEGRPLRLTQKRRQKYRAMHQEQLRDAPDPVAAWKAILYAVSRSDHHMSRRAYQMPESILLNEERRDRWVEEAIQVLNGRPARKADERSRRRREELLNYLNSRKGG